MPRYILLLFLVAIAPQPALANSDEDIIAFNESWYAYDAALESGDTPMIMKTVGAVVDAGRKIFAADDERLPLLMTNYGTALISGGQMDAAQKVLEEALELTEDIYGKNSTELIEILQPLGDSLAEVGFPARQLKQYKRALKITEQHYGHESVEYAATSMRAAVQSYERSSSTAGIKQLREAQEVYRVLYGDGSFEVGLAGYYLAKFEFTKQHYKSATEYALEALPILEGDSPEMIDMQLFNRALLVQAYEKRNMSEEATPHCVAIGRISKQRPEQDSLPLFRMAPQYPMGMLASGAEGFVELEFTIDENGFVRDPKVINAGQEKDANSGSLPNYSPSAKNRSFEAAATDAVLKFRYAPLFVDNVATPVEGVKTRITFRLEN